MSGMVFTDRVVDITYQELLPRLVDQINNSNIWTARVLSNSKNWRGVTLNLPIETANSTTGGSFSGMDTFPTAATNNTRLYTWYVAAYEQSVVVPGIERDVNANNEKQVLRLLSTRLDEAKVSAAVGVGTTLYGVGAGKDFDGLGLIVDDGTSTSSYGGLTRSTNTFVNATVLDMNSLNSGIITLDYLSSSFDDVSAAGSFSESPTLGLTTKAIWTFIEGLIQPMLSARYEVVSAGGYDRIDGGMPPGVSVRPGDSRLEGRAGFNALQYRARNMVADDMAPSGTYFWLNEHYIDFYALKSGELQQTSGKVEVTEGFYKDIQFPSVWQFRDMMSPVNQYGQVGLLMLMGNLVCGQPRRNAKMINITSN